MTIVFLGHKVEMKLGEVILIYENTTGAEINFTRSKRCRLERGMLT
jgi:hypothetical protein